MKKQDIIESTEGTLTVNEDGFMFPAQGDRGAVFIKATTIEEATDKYNSLTQ